MRRETKQTIGLLMLTIPIILMLLAIFMVLGLVEWYLPLIFLGGIIWAIIGKKLLNA